MRLIPLVLVAVAVAGCGPGLMALRVAGNHYRAGDSVPISLWNGSFGRAGYNLCDSDLERQDSGGAWIRVPDERGVTCLDVLLVLRPLATSRASSRALPASLAGGLYRISTRVESPFGAAWTRLASPPFEVIAGRVLSPVSPRTIALPRRLKRIRSENGIAVEPDPASAQDVTVEATPGLTVGVAHRAFAVAAGERILLFGGLGGNGYIGRSQTSLCAPASPIRAEPIAVELEWTIFETDIPPEHEWAPTAGAHYRELFHATIREEPFGCAP